MPNWLLERINSNKKEAEKKSKKTKSKNRYYTRERKIITNQNVNDSNVHKSNSSGTTLLAANHRKTKIVSAKTRWWFVEQAVMNNSVIFYENKPNLDAPAVRFKVKWILYQLPDFQQFKGDILNTLLDACRLVHCPRDTKLYERGQLCFECYIVLDGTCLLRSRPKNKSGDVCLYI